jgi:xanthine dehydrogenase YagS FAD-binding subunit
MNGNKIGKAQIALGGVGTRPWRSPEAERELAGGDVNERTFRKAAEVALHGAKPYRNNGFKVELAKRTLVRALQTVTASA